jgi:UDP-GlcNAc3NAcA epimerase
MFRILTILGARPQFIKAAPVSRAFGAYAGIEELILHSGQHFDANMSDVFFKELEIPVPKYNLGIQGGPHGAMTGRMLEKIEAVLVTETPDLVIVYGDTNTTLAGALAAAKLHIPIAHIEAGLRSWNRQMPEEINRILTDHVSDILFCPTTHAVKNLEKEGIGQQVIHSGDVMYDATLLAAGIADKSITVLEKNHLQPGRYCLATLHRAENTDSEVRLSSILTALNTISQKTPVVLPLHPRTAKKITRLNLVGLVPDVKMIDPVSFLEMVCLEKNAVLILTDSGGVQKEAYFHKIPCITLRDETEWIETVQAGWNTLAGADIVRILSSVTTATQGNDITEYGNGNAAQRIAETIVYFLSGPGHLNTGS